MMGASPRSGGNAAERKETGDWLVVSCTVKTQIKETVDLVDFSLR